MEKSQKVLVLSTIILVGFVLSIICTYFFSGYLNFKYPFNSFLYPSGAAFCDFIGAFPYIKDLKPYQDVVLWVSYFPLAYVFTIPFAFIQNIILSYLLYISGFAVYFIFMNIKTFACEKLNKLQNFQNIFILTIMPYPVLYLLDKGNFDMFLFVIVGLFAYLFKSEKFLLSSILLAVANAIKPFTVLFLFLFLFKKKYKEFFLSIIMTAFMIIGGFLIFRDVFFNQIINLIKTWSLFKSTYVYLNTSDFGMGYASSLFMPLKLLFCKITTVPIISTIVLSKFYDYLSLIITAVTLFFTWKEKVFWKQLTLLVCHFLLIPCITYDYKLIFLFIPIWFFVDSTEKTRFDLAYIILFALLLIPKHIVILMTQTSSTVAPWFSLSIIINPIIFILLSILIIYEQFYKRGTR